MEQAELVLLQLKNDVDMLKSAQSQHECQIETLALEIQKLGSEMENRFVQVHRQFKTVNYRLDTISKDLKLVLEALAIKY